VHSAVSFADQTSVVYYITSVLQLNVGLDRNLSLLLGGVINMMFFFGSLYPTFTLDKTGRRKPMMWGSFGCGFSMLMISVLLSFQMRGQNDPVAKATSSASVAFFFTVSRLRCTSHQYHFDRPRCYAPTYIASTGS
jgi:hypothetical protein